MKYAFIKRHEHEHSVRRMCLCLKVHPSGYYAWKAARNIDAWLRGATYAPEPKHELADFDKLNTWYYSDAPKTMRPMLDIIRANPPSTRCRAASMKAMPCSKPGAV